MILRAGCYERVSTDEQAQHGFSIKTQIDALEEYCTKNGIRLASHYCDDGVSGGKAASKRPEMSRLLEDIQEGKIDIVLFTRLDRWFRNVPEYYKVQEILDRHNVQWKAIWEDYDTTTSNGRMAITIFLAIAQAEREKVSDRVKVVFENKRKNGEALFSVRGTPFGYIAERDEHGVRRLYKHPDLRDALQEFWDRVVKYRNVSGAGKYVNKEYGLRRTDKSWREIVQKEVYTGTFRGVENYCEPYVSRKDWESLQADGGKVKASKAKRTYLFAGLIRCPECGRLLKSSYSKNWAGEECFYYRCRLGREALCDYHKYVSEVKAEAYLLDNLEKLLHGEIARVELARKKPKPKPKADVAKLREQLRRLNVTYTTGSMPDEEYIAEAKDLNARIAKAMAEIPDDPGDKDLTDLHELLETDFRSIYAELDAEDKRRFWRSIIKEIHVDAAGGIDSVIFL